MMSVTLFGSRLRPDWHRIAACVAVLLFWAACTPHAHAAGELAQYVSNPDSTYNWNEIRSGRFDSADYIEIILTSQTWRGIAWKHQLILFRPKRIDAASRQAFIYIDGGRWNPQYESGQGAVPREARIFTRLAASLHAPVAVLRQVPFEPVFDRREDALIAYTFDRYLTTGEPDWPLLLPMVKSAVRAMDTVQAVAEQRWHLAIERFTVAGASKRGWTSWLTAATDPRVASVAPMVIDMLNMPAQIRLQRATFGGLSEQVQDYESIDLPGRIDSDLGRRLIAMVDPYSYRASLVQPKLILLGTNDRYWPLDALRLYWNELMEQKRVLYVPNQGHGLRDLDRLVGALSALHRYSAHGEALPSLRWRFTNTDGGLELAVHPGRKPAHVTAWSASTATRDFRVTHWSHHGCRRSPNGYVCTQPTTSDGYTALYSEVAFKDRGERAFSLSTAVCIVGPADATLPQCLDNADDAPTRKD